MYFTEKTESQRQTENYVQKKRGRGIVKKKANKYKPNTTLPKYKLLP